MNNYMQDWEDGMVIIREDKWIPRSIVDPWGNRDSIWHRAEVRSAVPASEVQFEEEDPLTTAVRKLRADGIEIVVNPFTPMGAVLVAEAVNLAAKEISEDYYLLKPAVIDLVAQIPGVSSGWGDGAFYLSAPGAGTACFHDPNGEITSIGTWTLPWSGVCRQGAAFDCLADKPVRKQLALATAPKFAAFLARYQQICAGPWRELP